MAYNFRIDLKTRRLIVSDLTPSVKGKLEDLLEYADLSQWTIEWDVLDTIEGMRNSLAKIEIHLSKLSGLDITDEDVM